MVELRREEEKEFVGFGIIWDETRLYLGAHAPISTSYFGRDTWDANQSGRLRAV